jgi:hypothetical protein
MRQIDSVDYEDNNMVVGDTVRSANRLTGGVMSKIFSQHGRLILEENRLLFWSTMGKHEEIIIHLENIVEIKEVNAFLGLSREVWITLADGRVEKFIMYGRKAFIEAVKERMKVYGTQVNRIL